MNALLAAALAGVALGCAAPARADDGGAAALRAQLLAAAAKVQSVKMTMSSQAGGFTGTVTIVREPLRMHMEMGSGALTLESYVDAGTLYQRSGSGPWLKQPLPANLANADAATMIGTAASVAPAPDVTAGDQTYGAVTIAFATSLTFACTYDKQSYLIHECKNDLISETFSDYNDPANTVTLPPDVAR